MNGAWRIPRIYLTVFNVICILACCVNLSMASKAKAYDMPDEQVEWGHRIKIKCVPEDDRSEQDCMHYNVYWTRKNDPHWSVYCYDGKVTYMGAKNNSVRLNDDGSLTLTADYNSAGQYVCDYEQAHGSYNKTRTKVVVLESPLRVLECNGTSDTNQSRPCQVIVPNGTESLTFTVIKAGLQTNASILIDNLSDIPMVVKTSITANDDNSTTKLAEFEFDVSGLKSSRTLRFMLAGQSKDEFLVVLKRAAAEESSGHKLTQGEIAGIAVPVIIVVVVVVVVPIIYFYIRPRNCRGTPV